MTSEQINRAIAEQVMGWAVIEYSIKDGWKDIPRSHKGLWPIAVFLIDPPNERYARLERIHDDQAILHEEWSPTESIRDAIEAVDKWASAGLQRHYHLDNWGTEIPYRHQATLHQNGGVVAKSGNCETLSQAICNALLEAVKGNP